MAVVAVAATPAALAETQDVVRSVVGESTRPEAISDLRSCLTSTSPGTTPTLDVYYLIDASKSLFAEDETGGSDPDKVRAPILANSLRQLGSIPGISLNFASGYFGSEFEAGTDWTPVSNADAPEVAEAFQNEITSQQHLRGTNWALGIHEAQERLAEQRDRTGGCQLLIWFTDGEIQLSTQQETDDALNDLCGAQARSSGNEPVSSSGAFNALRQAGVVVVGALLNNLEVPPSSEREMQALVEGMSIDGQLTCGKLPISEPYVHGAYLRTVDTADLALVFLQLSAEVAGGANASNDLNGPFWIDPGVSRFTIATTDTGWTLMSPTNAKFTQDSDGITVDSSAGATQIAYSIEVGNDTGEWVWTRGDPNKPASLYLFSDLSITFDDKSIIRGQQSTISGQILRTDGAESFEVNVEDLNVYDYTLTLRVPTGDGTAGEDIQVRVADDGTFSHAFTAGQEMTIPTIDVTARLDLRTLDHDLALAPVVASQQTPLALPEGFPTVEAAGFSTIEGSNGTTQGTLLLHGPVSGDGQICLGPVAGFEPVPESLQDSAQRTWSWLRLPEESEDADGCVELVQGAEKEVVVSASTELAADSEVSAQVAVTSNDSAGETMVLSVPVRFQTTKPFSSAAFGLLVVALILLGILLPLLLLWLLNFFTARIVHGNNLTRAEFPVAIGSAGIVGRGVDLASASVGTDEFRFQANSPGGREVSDRALGRLRARTPWWPLAQPWFEIVPPAGMLVFGADARSPQKRAPAMVTGRRAAFSGDLGKLWAIAVSESKLAADPRADETEEGVPGTLVVYTRTDATNPNVFTDRMREIAMSFTATRTRISTAKDALAAEQRENGARGSSNLPVKVGAAAPGAAGASGVPPARSGDPDVPPPPPPPPRRGAEAAPPPPVRSTSATPAARRAVDSPPAPVRGGSPPPPPPAAPGGDEPPPLPTRR